MVRISKLTDYGIVLLAHMATAPNALDGGFLSARDLAKSSGLPLPTVGKLLKSLSRADFLYSERGVSGGYRLARSPKEITIAEVIALLEGPIAVTDCSVGSAHVCGLEHACPTKSNWQRISRVIHDALKGITLEDMSPRVRPAVSARRAAP